MPFSSHLWYLTFFALLLCILISYIMEYWEFDLNSKQLSAAKPFEHVKTLELSFLNMMAIFMQQPSAHMR